MSGPIALGLWALAVVTADHLVTWWVRRRLDGRALSLGPIGEIRRVDSRIWLHRGRWPRSTTALWVVWGGCALPALAAAFVAPDTGPWFGLLLGGAASHAVETSLRGVVCDYVCLRGWPAFDLADIAITVGAAGLVLQALAGIR